MINYTGPNQTWANALKRALDANIRIWQQISSLRDYFVFETTSSEENALPVYTVAVRADADGIHVSCDCASGMHNRVCMHAAQVLHDAGHLYPGNIRLIPLRGGEIAVIDAADYDLVSPYQWASVEAHNTSYARTSINNKTVRMHRLIMGAEKGQIVDHINHDGLDNRRSNLRFCTGAENQRNRIKTPERAKSYGTSQYKGVYWFASENKWRANIRPYPGKLLSLGLFKDEIDAALAYDKAARELFGEFASTNFPADYVPEPKSIRRTVKLGNRELSGRECVALLNGEW